MFFISVIVLFRLNGFVRYLNVFFWNVFIVEFKFECVVIMMIGNLGFCLVIVLSNVILFILGIFIFDIRMVG